MCLLDKIRLSRAGYLALSFCFAVERHKTPVTLEIPEMGSLFYARLWEHFGFSEAVLESATRGVSTPVSEVESGPRRLDREAAASNDSPTGLGLWDALPTDIAALARQTLCFAAESTPGPDARVRVQGFDCFDICATQALFVPAIQAFSGWLAALAEAGIQYEPRCVDGWRVCVLMEGVPLAIRVRERLHRVAQLDNFSARLESWLGGTPRTKLSPSGRLELQVMRFGVSAVSVLFDSANPHAAYAEVLRGLRNCARRESRYQNGLRQKIVARSGAPEDPAAVTLSSPLPVHGDPVLGSLSAAAAAANAAAPMPKVSLPPRSAADQLQALLVELRALASTQSADLAMTVSLANLWSLSESTEESQPRKKLRSARSVTRKSAKLAVRKQPGSQPGLFGDSSAIL